MTPCGRAAFALLMTLVLTLATGCSGNPPAVGAPPAGGLKELGEVYSYRARERKPAPKRLEDLSEFEATLGGAWERVQSGDIVVYWGVGAAQGDAGKAVLAYEKKAPTEGGEVLLRDGTVRTMSAAEFQAAAKAR